MSQSRIMKEFWGLMASHVWTFVIGVIVGMLLILFMQGAGDEEPRPGINLETIQPQPGYIPRELKP